MVAESEAAGYQPAAGQTLTPERLEREEKARKKDHCGLADLDVADSNAD